jgi:streptogramin lyase
MVVALAVGPDGNVYYTDENSVRRFEPGNGDNPIEVSDVDMPLSQPTSLAFDVDGTLLVGLRNPGMVIRLTLTDGLESDRDTEIDLSGDGIFVEGVAVDSDGAIYVSDATNAELVLADPMTNQTTTLVSSLAAPGHLAFSRGPLSCGLYIGVQGGSLGYYAADITAAF